eukprot:TRINITY_DN51063_c0_g1_i2.p1 TRINITY_DN51063_c0_g1~~TRINITY_DN51063_c0_g1_i2.p1  ORF type:complete len:331 (+),score=42.24 TRINITY_DN51063_c0_g1_i2:154-1146(+)
MLTWAARVLAGSLLTVAPCVDALLSSAESPDLAALKHESTNAQPQNFNVKVLRQLPHVGKPFTQGLEFRSTGGKSELVETSGSYPPGTVSFIRGVDLKTGATTWTSYEGIGDAFIEGIVQAGQGGHWFASVYQEPRKTLEYDDNFKFLATHPYHFDGWGLTRSVDGASFLATNGSSYVMTLANDGSFRLLQRQRATCLGKPVPAMNELEMVPDFLGRGPALLGNVYTSRVVVALDPKTMNCLGAFHLDNIAEETQNSEVGGFHVANGLAFNRDTGTFYVTGKNWDSMFEIEVTEEKDPQRALVQGSGSKPALDMLEDWLGTAHRAPGILP